MPEQAAAVAALESSQMLALEPAAKATAAVRTTTLLPVPGVVLVPLVGLALLAA
jgi:hypothetical protein